MLVSESIAARVPMHVSPLLNKLLAPIAMPKEEKQSECLKRCDCSQAQLTAKRKRAESTRCSFGAIRCRVVDVRCSEDKVGPTARRAGGATHDTADCVCVGEGREADRASASEERS